MADKKYELSFELSDGTVQKVEFTAPQGEQGIQGPEGPEGPAGPAGATGATGATGSAGKDGVVDVTGAKVGQTVRVTAVDGSGRPTAWEAVDYQPRTHYEFPEKVLAKNVTPSSAYVSWINYNIIRDYPTVTVVYDGTTYVCPVTIVTDITQAGDESYFYIGNYKNLAPEYPFSFFGYIGNDDATISPYSGHTYSVTANGVLQKIDNKFLDAEWMATIERSNVSLIPEGSYQNGFGELILTGTNLEAELHKGSTYRVVFEGVSYECVAIAPESEDFAYDFGENALILGNARVLEEAYSYDAGAYGEDTGEPFCLAQYGENWDVYLGGEWTEKEAMVCFGVYRVTEVPIKLPEKFLPESLVPNLVESVIAALPIYNGEGAYV